MKRQTKALVVMFFTAGIAACAASGPRAVAPPPALDRNGDRRVSYDEVMVENGLVTRVSEDMLRNAAPVFTQVGSRESAS
jgi:hypothetical protein